MTEDEMVGWQCQLYGHGFEEAPGVGDGQGSLVCCSPWGHKELDMTEQLNSTELACQVISLMQLLHYCCSMKVVKDNKQMNGYGSVSKSIYM